jgi:hypothetical protein
MTLGECSPPSNQDLITFMGQRWKQAPHFTLGDFFKLSRSENARTLTYIVDLMDARGKLIDTRSHLSHRPRSGLFNGFWGEKTRRMRQSSR